MLKKTWIYFIIFSVQDLNTNEIIKDYSKT